MGVVQISPRKTLHPGSVPGHGCISDTNLDTGVAGQGCEEAAEGRGNGCGGDGVRVRENGAVWIEK